MIKAFGSDKSNCKNEHYEEISRDFLVCPTSVSGYITEDQYGHAFAGFQNDILRCRWVT